MLTHAGTHFQVFLFFFSLLGPSYGHAPVRVFSFLERHKGGVLHDSQGKAATFYSRGVAEILLMNTHAHAHKHNHDTTSNRY